MGAFKAPKQPDPMQTAAAQARQNRDAATATQLFGAVDQVTDEGTLKYSQDGTYQYIGADGNWVSIPKLTATQTLNPEAQQARDLERQADISTNRIAVDQLGRVGDLLSRPVDLSQGAIDSRVSSMVNPRLDERYAKARDGLETQLANQGIRLGSRAYSDAVTDFERGKTDAYAQEALGNRQQAISEILQERNQPINETTALVGAQQIALPNWTNTPNASVAAPDYAGMVYQNAATKAQRQNAMMGGLFGLGGSVVGTAGKALTAGLL